MNACIHLQQSTCVRAPLSPSQGTCALCEKYCDSGKARAVKVKKGNAAASKPEPQPVPRAEWPLWAKAIERMRKPDDIGVGTTWERELGYVGTAIKAALKLMKIPCNCATRKAEWDVMYRY